MIKPKAFLYILSCFIVVAFFVYLTRETPLPQAEVTTIAQITIGQGKGKVAGIWIHEQPMSGVTWHRLGNIVVTPTEQIVLFDKSNVLHFLEQSKPPLKDELKWKSNVNIFKFDAPRATLWVADQNILTRLNLKDSTQQERKITMSDVIEQISVSAKGDVFVLNQKGVLRVYDTEGNFKILYNLQRLSNPQAYKELVKTQRWIATALADWQGKVYAQTRNNDRSFIIYEYSSPTQFEERVYNVQALNVRNNAVLLKGVDKSRRLYFAYSESDKNAKWEGPTDIARADKSAINKVFSLQKYYIEPSIEALDIIQVDEHGNIYVVVKKSGGLQIDKIAFVNN